MDPLNAVPSRETGSSFSSPPLQDLRLLADSKPTTCSLKPSLQPPWCCGDVMCCGVLYSIPSWLRREAMRQVGGELLVGNSQARHLPVSFKRSVRIGLAGVEHVPLISHGSISISVPSTGEAGRWLSFWRWCIVHETVRSFQHGMVSTQDSNQVLI